MTFCHRSSYQRMGFRSASLIGGATAAVALFNYYHHLQLRRTADCEAKIADELNIEANGIQLEGNLPVEDRLIARHMENVKGFFMGVFDGHGGWQVSELCQKKLAFYLDEALKGCSTEKHVK